MSNTLKLIERVRSKTATGTNYAVAKALEMDPSNLNRILKGKAWPGDKARQLMASMLPDASLTDIVALINEDKAKSDAERLHWRSLCSASVRAILDSAGPVAASLMIASVICFHSLYIMRRIIAVSWGKRGSAVAAI